MTLFKWAVILQIVLLVYFVITTVLPLYPWNDLTPYSAAEKWTEAGVNGGLILLNLTLFLSKAKWLMLISILFWGAFLLMQLIIWWMPYLTGKHLKQFPKSLHESHFNNTLKILPPIKDHAIPDAQHNVLQLLTTLVLILCTAVVFL